MIPATIYITEDYGVSHFADIDGNFPGIYSDNKLYYHVEGDFRGTSTTTITLPNTPGPSQRQARALERFAETPQLKRLQDGEDLDRQHHNSHFG